MIKRKIKNIDISQDKGEESINNLILLTKPKEENKRPQSVEDLQKLGVIK